MGRPLYALSSGLKIAYEDHGRGEPVLLFMPGWCDNRTQYRDLVPFCSSRSRCLVIDWPGHGESDTPAADFGEKELVAAAMSVIERSGARRIVTVSTAHAGWVAIELRRQLREKIRKLVLLDWLVLEPPQPFLEALRGLQSREHWEQVRESLFSMWLSGIVDDRILQHVRREMGAYGFEMWARAGREISANYERFGSPLKALSELEPPPHVLHLFSLPKDEAYLRVQNEFAKNHQWFSAYRLNANTHFPALEEPKTVSAFINDFIS
ncbi:MAG: alpha/beta hydrolase [Candidatus Caldarchaeum sp.]|uniref:Alpha/beta hydrolase n=1 Tax=Caldiarchaeum subterraneum TaxID=311458 RepID=A0A7C4I4G8_CALS0|nr:alpha/beta hydrolase [Candidatus Caldarchaeales archaeon]